MLGLIGKKIGMTQIYDASGIRRAVTVVQAGPCVIVNKKEKIVCGYDAVQLGFGEKNNNCISKPLLGHFQKARVKPCQVLKELKVESGDNLKVGDVVDVSIFKDVRYVDITGTTKGRGFQGVVKRHNMRGGPSSHGSMSHRRIGAAGQRAEPGRIYKGKRMPGHMGTNKVTVQNVKVVEIRPNDNVLLVEGSVPGPAGGILFIRKAIKKSANG